MKIFDLKEKIDHNFAFCIVHCAFIIDLSHLFCYNKCIYPIVRRQI